MPIRTQLCSLGANSVYSCLVGPDDVLWCVLGYNGARLLANRGPKRVLVGYKEIHSGYVFGS
jgi:hypothetical protein